MLWLLTFETGASNKFVYDTAQAAMDAFDTFAANFSIQHGAPYKDTMHWEQFGGAYAWVPNGYIWGAEHGIAWAQTSPDGLLGAVSVIPVDYNMPGQEMESH